MDESYLLMQFTDQQLNLGPTWHFPGNREEADPVQRGSQHGRCKAAITAD